VTLENLFFFFLFFLQNENVLLFLFFIVFWISFSFKTNIISFMRRKQFCDLNNNNKKVKIKTVLNK